MSTKVAQPIVVWPHKAAAKIGQEETQELIDVFGQIAATKVDRSEYDAHTKLIETQFQTQTKVMEAEFQTMRNDIKAQIRGALLTGLAWTTVLLAGLFGALYAFVQ